MKVFNKQANDDDDDDDKSHDMFESVQTLSYKI